VELTAPFKNNKPKPTAKTGVIMEIIKKIKGVVYLIQFDRDIDGRLEGQKVYTSDDVYDHLRPEIQEAIDKECFDYDDGNPLDDPKNWYEG